MSIQLKLDEWLEAAERMKHPRYASIKKAAEAFVQGVAEDIAAHAGVSCGIAEFEGMAFAGLCCSVQPLKDGDMLPEAFWGLDDGGIDEGEWSLPEGVTIQCDSIVDLR